MRKSKTLLCLFLSICCIIPAITPTYASSTNGIYEILNRSRDERSGKQLIMNALNKKEEQNIELLETKKQIEDKVKNKIDTRETYSKEDDCIIGLDISKWNGDIDWKAVKKAGIKFVIIRAGYGTGYVDPYFKSNIESAIDNNMIIGVYWFSYAHSYQQAKLEADKCYETIKPYKDNITLPVFWDFEYDSVTHAKKNGHSISKKLASGMADTFCTTIKNKGIQAGIYTNIDYSQRYFTDDVLTKYHTWIAQWTSKCTYKNHYIIWQATDKYYIGNKKFDLNYLYYNTYKKDIQNQTVSKKKMTVKATAYSGDSVTSTLIMPKWGVIAVDPSVIPYGSRVYIPRFQKVFVAEDCGGAIKGKRIDIFMNTEKEAMRWGVQEIEIYILQ